ncbi:hypothetical protein FA95DRAFT_1038977 [Auriscalpium vulgare]|uniref:Uncharacterized protein n=1 Tax=Auriscalpium vulgare TaxID=40419 RepID=A0ACB8RW68_9AGAM|nr:hypothetical protein FA95DRAFT_1038977 [Auriscalpium vulgare]
MPTLQLKVNMCTLPLDVQAMLIEIAEHRCGRLCYHRGLRLVCKSWTPVAQRFLYRRITYQTSSFAHFPLRSLFKTIRANPALGKHVRSLTHHRRRAKSPDSGNRDVRTPGNS